MLRRGRPSLGEVRLFGVCAIIFALLAIYEGIIGGNIITLLAFCAAAVAMGYTALWGRSKLGT